MTDEHQRLVDADARAVIASRLEDTLIVEAAAGTGKTTALVERIVRMIAEGKAGVNEIVAVTFTEKAAGELKLRLRERLDYVRLNAAASGEQRARLDEALTTLEEAHVGTIHAFCADLVRERPVEAGIDPLFDVLTERPAQRLFDEAFGRWLQEILEDPPNGVRRALRRSAFGGDEGPVDRLRYAAYELAQWRDFTTLWAHEPFDREAAVDSIVKRIHEFADLTANPSSRNDPLFFGTDAVRRLSDEIKLVQMHAEGPLYAHLYYDNIEAGLVDLSRDRNLANIKHGRGTLYRDEVRRDAVVAALDGLRAQLDQFRLDADADLATLLQRELRGATERYTEMKANAGALDFLDLLLVARDMVRTNRQVREGFQARFKRIFVDEFQDTDPLQAEILLLLAADDPGESDWRRARPVPGRLFVVGDPKQSIYRFRRADVAIYREVCTRLMSYGATLLHLTTSFRSVPEIQSFVNAAFAPVMTGDDVTLQADYVPLGRHRDALPAQPAVVVLPVPEPYARKHITGRRIEESLPGAVGAFVDWVVKQSGWEVTERSGAAPVPVAAKHICLLFRRFVSWENDVTRAYVEALEARGIPHVLVGGRAFHEREEVEALRAALAAIEWPDDELSVFATLRGPFFAVGDEELLEWTQRFGHTEGELFKRGRFRPFQIPAEFRGDPPLDVAHLKPIADALALLRELHRNRNYGTRKRADGTWDRAAGGVSWTLQKLLVSTRAHVGFALRTGGEQALANILHIAEIARQYEMGGGISFRGFVEELRVAAETAQASEAPILEEDSDGVRMMTVHKAKGLEFPIVILADLTCRLSRPDAGRWIDATGNLCALRLGGWSPRELILHGYEEAARDKAEGERLAYVAATRARDVLVVPAVGDEVFEGGWLDPLMPAVYPSLFRREMRGTAPGCPPFPSKDSVLTRPDGDIARPTTVAPGAYAFHPSGDEKATPSSEAGAANLDPREANRQSYSVVWWDPHVLSLNDHLGYGLRRDDLIAKDGDPTPVAERLSKYRTWQADRDDIVARARARSMNTQTVTAAVLKRNDDMGLSDVVKRIDVIDVSRSTARPFGPRFGSLVHATLATVPLDAGEDVVLAIATTQGRILPTAKQQAYADEEVYAAVEVVTAVLRDPLFDRVRAAERAARCHRELPVVWKSPDGTLVEGAIDLAFEDPTGVTVLDFKTDRELTLDLERYKRQLAVYCQAMEQMTERPAKGLLLRV
jgi:ATP-dependent helicase/nuclease subunit A